MFIEAEAAKALFAVIMSSTQGIDALTFQLPLRVEDRGDSWLVIGSPFTSSDANFCMTNMFFRKDSGEVIGIMSHGRVKTTEAEKVHWLTIMSHDEYDRVFGPPTHFEPNGVHEMYIALSGGLINTAADAAVYAAALLHATPSGMLQADDLRAIEVDGVWHVTKTSDADAAHELLSFSRKNGRVVSGDA